MNKIKKYRIILFVLLLQTSSLFAQSKKDTTKVINLKGADVTFEKSGVMISIQPREDVFGVLAKCSELEAALSSEREVHVCALVELNSPRAGKNSGIIGV